MNANFISSAATIALSLLSIVPVPAIAGWEANLPDPMSYSSTLDAPYRYVGILRKESGSTGSATVIKYPKVLLTAAHVIYDEDGNLDTLPRWFNRYHGTTAPDYDAGTELYGHRRFNNYVNYLQGGGAKNDKEAFDYDTASVFGFENMAGGGTAAFHSDGKSLLTSITKDKRVVGYPVTLYSDDGDSPRPLPANDDDHYKMHTTSPVSHRFWKVTGTDDYYTATGQIDSVAKLVSAPGNSGGPVFVKDGDTWKAAGVFVSVKRDYLINGDSDVYSGRAGTRAIDGNVVTGLLDPLSGAGECNYSLVPSNRNHSHTGGSGSVAVKVGAGCSWYTSISFQNSQWIHLQSPTTGKGNGTLNYDLEPNPLATTRIGTFSVGGETFTIQQAGHATVDLRDRGSNWRSLSHTERFVGQTLTVQAGVYNGGNSNTSTGFKVRYYASANTIINPLVDTLLGEKNLGPLSHGQWVSIDKQLEIPSGLAGNYYIGWKIDAINQVAEADETNNIVVMDAPVFIKTVDLHDAGSQYHEVLYTQVHPGHAVRTRGAVRNDGNAESGVFDMKFFLSPVEQGTIGGVLIGNGSPAAPQIEAGDVYLGKQSFSISGNASKPFDMTFTTASNLPRGYYKVKWAIDGSNSVPETNEGNNVVMVNSPRVHILSTVDLKDRGPAYQGLSHSERKPGQSLTITGDVVNGGNTASGPFKIGFYASTDDHIDPDTDLKLGEKSMAGLNSGSFAAVDLAVVLPNTMTAGSYYIGWYLDIAGTATQNQGMVLVGNGGGALTPITELVNNNAVTVTTPILKVSTLGLTIGLPGGGGGNIDDIANPESGDSGKGGERPGINPVVQLPQLPQGQLVIQSIRMNGQTFEISTNTSVDSISYTLESSVDAKNWSAISTVRGTGKSLHLKDPKTTESQKFYRIRSGDVTLKRG
ncbi:MAG: CARDB domain-containing protein [Verrucomicrobiales bacterium]